DGDRIVFWGEAGVSSDHIFVVTLAGGALDEWPGEEERFDDNPAWSRDGERIVFDRVFSDQSAIALLTADPDGSNQIEIPDASGSAVRGDWGTVAVKMQGDLDCDDDADLQDMVVALRFAAGLGDAACQSNADTDCDQANT